MTGRRASRGSRRAGFLLVEALATLAIGAFVVAGLAGLITVVIRLGDRTAADLERRETIGRAVAGLEREIRGMSRGRFAGERHASFLFAGAPDRLLFTLDRPDATGLLATTAVAYRAGVVDDRAVLLRSEAPVPPDLRDARTLAFPAPVRLYRGDLRVAFAYFAAQADGSGEVLTDDWTKAGKLPAAIRIALTDRAGTLVDSVRVPILVDAEPGCAVEGKGFCSLADQKRQGEGAAAQGEPGTRPNRNRNGPASARAR